MCTELRVMCHLTGSLMYNELEAKALSPYLSITYIIELIRVIWGNITQRVEWIYDQDSYYGPFTFLETIAFRALKQLMK